MEKDGKRKRRRFSAEYKAETVRFTSTGEEWGVFQGRFTAAEPGKHEVTLMGRKMPVAPGDVIASGTCGSGCLAEGWGRLGRREPRPLEPGDVVTMTIEGIGSIGNEVVVGAALIPIPRART